MKIMKIINNIFANLLVIASILFLWFIALAAIMNKFAIENKHIVIAIICAAIYIGDKIDGTKK